MAHALPGYMARRFEMLGGSPAYWERRYSAGGNSGDGSYGRLAAYKADFLNRLIRERTIGSVIEFGCGDGHQLSLLEVPRYLGLDVSRTAVELCGRRFAGDVSKRFMLYDPYAFPEQTEAFRAEAAFSLDVLFHLVEDEIYELYLRHLFGAAQRLVVIYSTNEEAQAESPHVRRRRFADSVERDYGYDWALALEEKADFSECGFYVYERR